MILNVYTYAAMFVRGSIFPKDIIAVNVYNNYVLINGDDNVNWPPYRDSKS